MELLGDRPLIAHVRARLAPQVGAIVISANRDHAQYRQWGDRVVADTLPGLGPLGGLLAALDVLETDFACCVPGDAPCLPATLVARLATALDAPAVDLVLPHDGQREQPLFLLMRRDVVAELRRFLAQGGRAAHRWVAGVPHRVVDMSSDRAGFANINTPDELAGLRAAHADGGV